MATPNITLLRRRKRGVMTVAALAACLWITLPGVRAQDSKLADGPPPPPSEESSSQPDTAAPPAAKPAPVDPWSSGPARPDEPEGAAPPAPANPRSIRLRPSQPDPEAPAAAAAPAQPMLDPVGASRSLEVGTFYFKKGDYDAAIDRFKEAAERQPKLAKPYLLLGEAYEKKNDPASAVSAYRKYLQLYQKAPDEDKVNKRIERLTALESKRDPLQQ